MLTAVYNAAMHSPNLTEEQLRRLHGAIEPKWRYFYLLRCRMDQKHFPSTDPLYVLVGETIERLEAMQAKILELKEKAIF
jgi:hypothetical protein